MVWKEGGSNSCWITSAYDMPASPLQVKAKSSLILLASLMALDLRLKKAAEGS